MEEFISAYGTCYLDANGTFWVDGKETFNDIKNVTYMRFKRDSHIYMHLKKGGYKLYSLKERRVLLSNINRVLHRTKTIAVVTYSAGNEEKYYLHNFIDNSKSRYIKKIVNQVILEEDGFTLSNTRSSKEAITLPVKCKDLCEAKEIIDCYAITENNEILALAPFPYNFSKTSGFSKPLFWKLEKSVDRKILKNVRFKNLVDLIHFETDEEKKLFALVSILYNYKFSKEKIYFDNVNNILIDKQISFEEGKFSITLTLDKIILADKLGKAEYSYDILEYDKFYLQNLISYHLAVKNEQTIKELALNKTPVEEVISSTKFSFTKESLNKIIYYLNCNPNSKIFYVINNKNQLVMVNRKQFVENIVKALFEKKKFKGIVKRYSLNSRIVEKMIQKNLPKEYNVLKNNNMLSN